MHFLVRCVEVQRNNAQLEAPDTPPFEGKTACRGGESSTRLKIFRLLSSSLIIFKRLIKSLERYLFYRTLNLGDDLLTYGEVLWDARFAERRHTAASSDKPITQLDSYHLHDSLGLENIDGLSDEHVMRG